ncbi:flagellin [Pseudovibrio sp. SCP19]|uniref:flagellin N-terminal helical domain-containing protein n=1 Tax=Pseudovibrio sp. SCP19 TaxID=3141374 RepID=UPI00333DB4C3
MADITLTAAVRTNLNTLQSTASLISDTQERLSTGKKVNSALDNPNSFFTASSLNSRASDLSNLQDDIGQSVSTLEAADKGIEAIDKLLDAAKGKANQALQTQDIEERAQYAAEFNELRTQIEDIAKDSGYKGKNLLGGDGNDLLVKFNEDGSSNLNIGAVDYTDLDSSETPFKLNKIEETVESQEAVDFANNEVALAFGVNGGKYEGTIDLGGVGNDSSTALNTLNGFTDGDNISYDFNSAGAVDFVIGSGPGQIETIGDLAAALDDVAGISTTLNADGTIDFVSDETLTFTETDNDSSGAPGGAVSGTTATLQTLDGTTNLSSLKNFSVGDSITYKVGDSAEKTFEIGSTTTLQNFADVLGSDDNINVRIENNTLVVDSNIDDIQLGFIAGTDNPTTGAEFGASGGVSVEKDTQAQARIAGNGWGDDSFIENSLDQVREAQLSLRAQASTFGTNLSVVTNRQDFTADLINTLEVGAGKLTLADSNLEGANLAALNTQNQIATSTLSLATQAGQSVLQLIR